jgi:hypothetical protein
MNVTFARAELPRVVQRSIRPRGIWSVALANAPVPAHAQNLVADQDVEVPDFPLQTPTLRVPHPCVFCKGGYSRGMHRGLSSRVPSTALHVKSRQHEPDYRLCFGTLESVVSVGNKDVKCDSSPGAEYGCNRGRTITLRIATTSNVAGNHMTSPETSNDQLRSPTT